MNFNMKRKRKHNSFNLRNDIYNQRVDNNVTKQFRERHNPTNNTEYITDEITDSQGLERAYQHGDYYTHGDRMYIAGSHIVQDWYDDFIKIPAWGNLRNSARCQASHSALKSTS